MRKFMSAKISDLIKVESLLPKFETHEKCWNEKKVRVKKLSASSSYRARLLAEKLSDCNEEQGEIVNILLKIKNSFLPTKQILIGL